MKSVNTVDIKESYFSVKGSRFMSDITAGSSITTSLASQATILKEAQLQNEIDVAILSDVLETQEAIVKELLQSLGIGQNIDIRI